MINDYTQLLEQKNIQHAIIGDVIYSLNGILHNLTKVKLSAMASANRLPGYSKMKKDELIAALSNYVTDAEVLRTVLLYSRPKEWKLYESVLSGTYRPSKSSPYGYYAYFLERGMLVTFFVGNQLHLIIPDEVRSAIEQVNNDEFQQELDRIHLILDYTLAAANLYGVIRPDQLVEIFNAHHESVLSEEELLEHLTKFLEREQYFEILEGYIVSLDMGETEFADILENMEHKPYYIPDEQEFLKYSDQDYFEMTPQLAALKAFVAKELCRDPEMVEYLVDDIQLGCSLGADLQDLLYEFEKRDIEFQTMSQAQTVVSLITDVYNHTRIWTNGGHTPAELSKAHENSGFKPTKAPFRAQVKNQASVVKIGRNDPCPCGSGLKYKKCCGK